MTLGFGIKNDTKPVAIYDQRKMVEILAAEFAKHDAHDSEEREDEERHDDARNGSRSTWPVLASGRTRR
jgi:hypothetical protein